MEANSQKPIYEKINQLESEISDLKAKLIEQKSIEDQLRKAQKMEALATLSSGVAHDFNNILQSILGYTQLAIIKDNGSDPDHHLLFKIEDMVKKGAELSMRFITLGNKDDYRIIPLDINNNIQDLEKLLTRTLPRNLAIVTELSDALNMVNADSSQIDQVIMNICINARDSMPDGGIISLTTENILIPDRNINIPEHILPGDYVLVTISDSITEEPSNLLPQKHQTPYPATRGSGLGLSMAYSIIEDFDGYIDFSNITGQGNIFKIYIPSLNSHDSETQTERGISARGDVKGSESVLLVDDDPEILLLGKKTLEIYGYNISTAFNGEEALKSYTGKRTDIVLLDIGMPGMGGLRCIHELIKIDPEVKIMVMSGYASKEHRNNALGAGAKYFLPKPYTINEILSGVKETLN